MQRLQLDDLSTVTRVHLVAVCGVAMAALAGMLKQRGLAVSGSDENVYPPMSTLLERLGIAVMPGYCAENVAAAKPDLIVIGNKVSRDNPEVQAVLASGIPYVSLPEALGRFFIAGRRSLVVAGTHGKTTCTSMLGWVLEASGRDPSVMVGGESLNFHGNFKLGDGEHFVIEGDEYDSAFFDKGPKFLHYRPSALLLNAVEFDHADIYADLAAVKAAFGRLLALLGAGAPLVVSSDFPCALDVVRESGREGAVTFGLGEAAEWRVGGLVDDGTWSRFRVLHRGADEGELRLRQPGAINARNALGVYVLARAVDLAHGEVARGLEGFLGVRRRQEVVGTYDGIVLIDDFAHHPTAVAGTIEALRQRYPRQRLWALFEPRSNTSRRKVFQKDFVTAFRQADHIVIGGVFKKASDAVGAADLFSPEQLVDDLEQSGKSARTLATGDEIAAAVAAEAEPGDVVVMMSNGDFGGLRRTLASRLAARVQGGESNSASNS
jgi:UDP-N-acetylmuramate: L-alanyl-gamma-D-glutamyl-meso-diaminopimelate ligase